MRYPGLPSGFLASSLIFHVVRLVPMKHSISWTARQPDGVKRETRARVTMHSIKWQFKRADEERWDYDSTPTPEDWDALEDILKRRSRRGRALNMYEAVRKLREKVGA